jgi:hypothetical protein
MLELSSCKLRLTTQHNFFTDFTSFDSTMFEKNFHIEDNYEDEEDLPPVTKTKISGITHSIK